MAGVKHTSMSVGDVAVDESGAAFMVATVGFSRCNGDDSAGDEDRRAS